MSFRMFAKYLTATVGSFLYGMFLSNALFASEIPDITVNFWLTYEDGKPIPKGISVDLSQPIYLHLESQGSGGLLVGKVRWHGDGTGFSEVDRGHTQHVDGQQEFVYQTSLSGIEEAGEYRLCAEAWATSGRRTAKCRFISFTKTSENEIKPRTVSAGSASESFEIPSELIDKLKRDSYFSSTKVKLPPVELGADLRALVRAVQRNIRYQPYRGVLRGERGVTTSQAANSYDRSVMLADMLRDAGYQVRFAKARLSREQASALLESVHAPVKKEELLTKEVDHLMGIAGEHFLYLEQLLFDSGFAPNSNDAVILERHLEAARDHVWLQVQQNGSWIDIDSTPGIDFGERRIDPQLVTDDLNKSDYHWVNFVIEVEVAEEGQQRSWEILSYTAKPEDLAGRRLGLYNSFTNGVFRSHLVVDKNTVDSQNIRLPIGGMGRSKGPFSGFMIPMDPFSPGVKKPAPDQRSDPRITGQRLIISVETPDGTKRSHHVVFQAESRGAESGAEDKQGLTKALNTVLGFGVSTGDVNPDAISNLFPSGDVVDTPVAVSSSLALLANLYFLNRRNLPASFFNSEIERYLDAPNVVVAQASMSGDTTELSFNLAMKSYRVFGNSHDNEWPMFYEMLANGVVDHTVERSLLEGLAGASVGALFESVRDEDIPLLLIRDITQLGSGELTDDVAPQLKDALARGQYVVTVKERPSDWGEKDLGWWEIDPHTGWTVDTDESGRHSAGTEYGVTGTQVSLRGLRSMRQAHCTAMLAVAIGAAATTGVAGAEAPPLVKLLQSLLDVADNFVDQCGKNKIPIAPSTVRRVMARGVSGVPNRGFHAVRRVMNNRAVTRRGGAVLPRGAGR